MLREYAAGVTRIARSSMFRQKSVRGSPGIPDEPKQHSLWGGRYTAINEVSRDVTGLRQERNEIARHTIASCCRLMVDLGLLRMKYTTRAARLVPLRDFLRDRMIDIQCDVLLREDNLERGDERRRQFVTIVGNWFAATAVRGTQETG